MFQTTNQIHINISNFWDIFSNIMKYFWLQLSPRDLGMLTSGSRENMQQVLAMLGIFTNHWLGSRENLQVYHGFTWFYHKILGFPVNFPLDQSNEPDIGFQPFQPTKYHLGSI